MSSVKSLTQEWMDLVLSKPSIASDLSVKSEKLRVSKSDEMKLKIEFDSREKEAESLREQLRIVQEKFRSVHHERLVTEGELKTLVSESSRLNAESWELLKSESTKHNSVELRKYTSEHNRMVTLFPDAAISAEADSLRKLQHVIASIISRNSSRLSSMMTDRCDSEMQRTRRIDSLLTTEQELLKSELEKLMEVSKYVKQSADIRSQYDTQAAEDFRDLVELALAADSLEKDLKSGEKSRKQIIPKKQSADHSRINDLQIRVSGLRQQVAEAQAAYVEESKNLQSDLISMKVEKRNMKMKFQADIKSIFADLEFLAGRIDRTESSLEKANIHYQLDEEEIVNVVAPIIDGIDGLRDKLDSISRDAQEIFYGN